MHVVESIWTCKHPLIEGNLGRWSSWSLSICPHDHRPLLFFSSYLLQDLYCVVFSKSFFFCGLLKVCRCGCMQRYHRWRDGAVAVAKMAPKCEMSQLWDQDMEVFSGARWAWWALASDMRTLIWAIFASWLNIASGFFFRNVFPKAKPSYNPSYGPGTSIFRYIINCFAWSDLIFHSTSLCYISLFLGCWNIA